MISNIAEKITPIKELLDKTETELKDRGGAPKLSIKSLPGFNAKIWGLRRGLTIIGARSSMGKSAFALQIAGDIADQNIPVLFLSLEMDEQSMLERLFCAQYRIDNFDLISGKYNTDESIKEKWEMFKKFMDNAPLLFTCGIGKNFSEITKLLEHLEPLPKVIIVDYIQGIKQSDKERAEMNEYIRNFRQLMLQKDCVGVLASQMNRQIINNDNKRPELENLKGTGVLEEHADVVLLLYWEWFYTREDKDKNKYEIIVAKNRNGRTGSHSLFYTPEWYLFSEEPWRRDC